MQYNHYGVPTQEKKPDEALVEIEGFRFYATPFEANPYHIQWMRFEEGHGLPEIITRVPHIAFTVDDMQAAIAGKKVILGPYFPLKGYEVAMIEEGGVVIEFIKTELSDAEVTVLENEKREKGTS